MFAFISATLLALASPPEVFAFDAAVTYTLEHHPELRAAQWTERASQGNIAVARATSLPLITGTGVAYRLSQNSTVTLARSSISATLQIMMPLVAPQAWGDWKHARTASVVQHRHTQEVRRALAIAVAQAYFDVVLAARLIAVGDNAVEQGKAHFSYAHTRFAGGVGTELDELRADQDLAQSEQVRVNATDNLLQMQAALGVAMGFDRAVGAQVVQTIPIRGDGRPEDVESRADVQEALEGLRAAEEIENDNWRDYSPTLLLRGAPFVAHPSTAILPTWGWSASVALAVPFYDGGVRYGLARERHSLTQQRQATLDLVRRRARSEARAAHAAMALAEQARDVSARAAGSAREAVALASQAYRQGSTDNLAVIDAQRSDRDAATAVAIADDTVLRARLAYLAAVGMFPP